MDVRVIKLDTVADEESAPLIEGATAPEPTASTTDDASSSKT